QEWSWSTRRAMMNGQALFSGALANSQRVVAVSEEAPMTDGQKSRDEELFTLLRATRLLDSLPDRLLARLEPMASVEYVNAKSVLFAEGSRCDRLFFVIDGVVALDMSVPRREPTRILTIGPGEVLAWSALLGDQRMTATATALEKTRLVSIGASALRQLC